MIWYVVGVVAGAGQRAHATYTVKILKSTAPVNPLIHPRYRRFFRSDKTTLTQGNAGKGHSFGPSRRHFGSSTEGSFPIVSEAIISPSEA